MFHKKTGGAKMTRFMTMLAAVLLSGAASAEYFLYWQIDQSEATKPVEFSYAALYSLNAAEKEAEAVRLGDYVSAEADSKTTNPVNTFVDKSYTKEEDYQFQFKLFDKDFEEVGLRSYNWEDLVSYAYSSMATTGATPLTITSFAGTAPEPTSGLLLLIGVAGLALRRKRA